MLNSMFLSNCTLTHTRHITQSLFHHLQPMASVLHPNCTRMMRAFSLRYYTPFHTLRFNPKDIIFTRGISRNAQHNVRVGSHSKNLLCNIRSNIRIYCSKSREQDLSQSAKNIGNTSTKSTWSEIKRLLSLAKPEKWKLVGAVVLLVVSSTVSMAVPYSLGKVINIITDNFTEENKDYMATFCKILLVIFTIGATANFGRVYLINVTGNNIVKRLRERLFSSIMRQETAFFEKNKTGELVNRLSTDTSIVGNTLTQNVSDGLRAVMQSIGGVGLMIYMSPKMALLACCIVPPIFLASRIFGRYMKDNITKKIQDSLADATQVAQERISNMKTVRSFAQEEMETERYNMKIEHVLQLTYKEALAKGAFWSFTGFSGNFMIISMLYYGGHMVTSGQITVGELTSFLLYALYVGISISGLSNFYAELMKGIGASSRLWYLTDRIPEIPISGGIIPKEPMKGNVEFKDISFSYPTREHVQILNNLSLTVPAGSITAVVGASGSGKSTIGSLLLRLYDPNEGEIVVDGISLKDLNPMWIRSHIGSVSQEPSLFSCSIAENISYGLLGQDVPISVIQEAAKKANAHKFIMGFTNGYDTIVGERGQMLSGGQKQRIAIARALIKDPKILLLDEATSALDAESEYLVKEALERAMVGRTVITIAHRLSTIKSANQIAVLSDGKVAEIGNYQELIQIPDGIFRKLVEKQTIS